MIIKFIYFFFAELIKVHDETLEQTKSWFLGSSDFVRKGIVDHYGQIPDTEQDYWTLPNGPTWLWWVLNTLPIDPPLKVSNFFDYSKAPNRTFFWA